MPTGQRIWAERVIHVHSVRRFQVGAGKTGKGILHVWQMESTKQGYHRCGQAAAVDVEDIVWVSDVLEMARQ